MTNPNPNSILDSVKKVVGGFTPDFTDFDLDFVMFINAALVEVNQLGVGPETGFSIADNTALWSSLTSRTDLLGMVKTFVSLRTRTLFDPSSDRFVVQSIESILIQLQWRLTAEAENDPFPVVTGNSAPKWWDLTGLSDFPTGAVAGDWGYDLTTGDIYTNQETADAPGFWDVTGLSDFPAGAVAGDLGIDTATGDVWSYSTS